MSRKFTDSAHECNGWCRGDDHAQVIYTNHNDTARVAADAATSLRLAGYAVTIVDVAPAPEAAPAATVIAAYPGLLDFDGARGRFGPRRPAAEYRYAWLVTVREGVTP